VLNRKGAKGAKGRNIRINCKEGREG